MVLCNDREISYVILCNGKDIKREILDNDREMSCLILCNGREMRMRVILVDDIDDELCDIVQYDRDMRCCALTRR